MTNTIRETRETEFAAMIAQLEPWQLQIVYRYIQLLKEDKAAAKAYAAQIMQELEAERKTGEGHHAKQEIDA